MLDPIAAAGIGGIIGGALVWLAMKEKTTAFLANRDYWVAEYDIASDALLEANTAHTRCADALTTTQRKLSAIRDLLDKPRTIRKGELAMILDGERV